MDYILTHHHYLWYLVGAIGLIIELTVIGLSGPLLFIAIASFITGVFVHMGLISSIEYEILSLGCCSLIISALLWKPLKRFQNSPKDDGTSSDMVGLTVKVSQEVTKHTGLVRYSGIDWNANLDDDTQAVKSIAVDSYCKIVRVHGNTLVVSSVD